MCAGWTGRDALPVQRVQRGLPGSSGAVRAIPGLRHVPCRGVLGDLRRTHLGNPVRRDETLCPQDMRLAYVFGGAMPMSPDYGVRFRINYLTSDLDPIYKSETVSAHDPDEAFTSFHTRNPRYKILSIWELVRDYS